MAVAPAGPLAAAGSGSVSGLNTAEVREWAKAQGIEVKDRGRVPAEVVVKFKAATGQEVHSTSRSSARRRLSRML